MTEVNLYSFLVVYALQCLGAFEHWRHMKKGERVRGSFFKYLVSDNVTRTTSVYVVLLGSAWASCAGGIADNLNPELLFAMLSNGKVTIGMGSAVMSSLAIGYGLDSYTNKSAKE